MSIPLQILYHGRSVFTGEVQQKLEMGRQQHDEPRDALFQIDPQSQRLVMAALDETRIGRQQLLIEETDQYEQIRLTNLSNKVRVEVIGHGPLPPLESMEVLIPVQIAFPSRHTVVLGDQSSSGVSHLETLGSATLAPGQVGAKLAGVMHNRFTDHSPQAEQLVQAMQATMDIFQSARSERELFLSAIEGSIQLAGVDRAIIVDYRNGSWIPQWDLIENAQSPAWKVSQTVLHQVAHKKQTFWENGVVDMSESLANVDSVIAAPILDAEGNIIAALYGDRRINVTTKDKSDITRLEALLIELLACAVAAGLARLEQERKATVMRLQFEQYFTKKLAEELEANPDLINGRDADVSILFCDIRAFSRISEKIGTSQTFTWINDVMGVLSESVEKFDGVLVDYIGDELMAMWGAPKSQPNHAELAARAALDMYSRLDEIDSRWESVIGAPLGIGIGINSGQVRAGNAGSQFKFKYSPLGNTVNLASRVQGVTKYLKAPVLVTGDTAERLPTSIPRRRLCSVRVVNIVEPVPLYELRQQSEETLTETYQNALTSFERKEFRAAAGLLSGLLEQYPDDGPALVLLSRAVNALVDGADPDHPIWQLSSK